jgi:hypothetical protein
MYLLVVLWNAIMAATREVVKRAWPIVAALGPRCVAARLKMTSVPCSRATATIWSGPTATVIAQEANVYRAAIAPTDR